MLHLLSAVRSVALLISALSFLAGCQMHPIRDVPLLARNTSPELASADAMIFGRIKFIVNGKVMDKCFMAACPRWILARNPRFDHEGFRRYRQGEFQAKQPIADWDYYFPNLDTDSDGSFYYVVPTGHYAVARLGIAWYDPSIYPALEFDVPEPGVAYYVGTIVVDVDVTRYLGGLHGVMIRRINQVETVDELDRYAERLHARNPDTLKLPIKASLMRQVERQHPVLAPYAAPLY